MKFFFSQTNCLAFYLLDQSTTQIHLNPRGIVIALIRNIHAVKTNEICTLHYKKLLKVVIIKQDDPK